MMILVITFTIRIIKVISVASNDGNAADSTVDDTAKEGGRGCGRKR